MKTNTPSLILVSMLAGVAFLQPAQAVVPPPDGGYPGFNTAEGTNALKNLTTGVGNTAVGWFSLKSDTDGSLNTAVGAGTHRQPGRGACHGGEGHGAGGIHLPAFRPVPAGAGRLGRRHHLRDEEAHEHLPQAIGPEV